MDLIDIIERQQLKESIPDLGPGDTVRIQIKVVEGGKERLQAFEGICISRNGNGVNEMFTLRKIASHGIGVERTFPIHSPRLANIEIKRRGDVRRAKLYYLRKRIGKAATRVKEKRFK
ncbi:MAG: 50S ribosomal protein L19 [Candidatus Eremiobacteraeota bacterium]|nr:50S ribosomal protein L19 [Candidatus Eremiobacteraeota bacterium]